MMIVGTKAVTLVPNGTVTAIVWLDSVTTPVAAGLVKENAVIAFVVEAGGLPGAVQPRTIDACIRSRHKLRLGA